MSRPTMLGWPALVAVVLAAPACDSLYYKTMKRFGVEKRDILVKRVRDAREAQQEGKEEFRSALDRELQRSEGRAREIHDKAESVRDVADKELVLLRTNVDALVSDLEASIAEAESFITQMDGESETAPP